VQSTAILPCVQHRVTVAFGFGIAATHIIALFAVPEGTTTSVKSERSISHSSEYTAGVCPVPGRKDTHLHISMIFMQMNASSVLEVLLMHCLSRVHRVMAFQS
jgi:hypothetical protein